MDLLVAQVLLVLRRMWKYRWPGLLVAWIGGVVGAIITCAGLLLMATIALLAPAAVANLELARSDLVMRKLSLGLAVLVAAAVVSPIGVPNSSRSGDRSST